MQGLTLFTAALVWQNAWAVQPVVHLDYASYKGTALSNGITQWLGMRYAAPPLKDLRFAAPQPPLKEYGLVTADQHGPTCLSTGTSPPSNSSNEDCLVLDIYAPSSATPKSKLPVYFFIQGGGFNSNSNANYNGSGLIEYSKHNIIVVNFNYRVGLYGFLASNEVAKHGSINNGLKDQRFAMQWVQKYISQFGGDPSQVTMGGDSAGAQSVTLHLTAYGGRNDNLFARTAAESQSFSALRTVPESEFAYNDLLNRTNCSSLSCLRSLPATKIQEVNTNIPFPGGTEPPLYMYGPTLDFDFITDYTYRAYAQGKFIRLPAIYGDDTNEGTIFTPKNTSSYAASNAFLRNQFPYLTPSQLATLNALYPVARTPSFPDSGRFWRQVSDVYGEMRYICPGLFISQASSSHARPAPRRPAVWNYRWDVQDPPAAADGRGVTHTVEVNALWGAAAVNGGAPASYAPGGVNSGMSAVVRGYWVSFVRSGDVNRWREPGTPRWEEFGGRMERLRFRTGGNGMEAVGEGQRRRCEYLWSIAVENRQ